MDDDHSGFSCALSRLHAMMVGPERENLEEGNLGRKIFTIVKSKGDRLQKYNHSIKPVHVLTSKKLQVKEKFKGDSKIKSLGNWDNSSFICEHNENKQVSRKDYKYGF